MGAVVTVNNKGEVGAACHGIDTFPFAVASNETNGPKLHYVQCLKEQS